MEDTLREFIYRGNKVQSVVLILVLMEDTLRAQHRDQLPEPL